MAYKGFTEARAKANKKYLESQAEIKLRMQPEQKEEIRVSAEQAGESINAYIMGAVAKRMEQERE